jgi:hypothetical protein
MPRHTPAHTEPLSPRDEALRRALLIVVEQHAAGNLTEVEAGALTKAIVAGYWRGVEAQMITELSDYARAQIEAGLISAGLMSKPGRASRHPHGHTGRL